MNLQTLEVTHTADFTVTGRGDHPAWRNVRPVPLQGRCTNIVSDGYHTWFKTLWSDKGFYFYIDCQDKRLSCTRLRDFDDLFWQDVAEVFLWPCEDHPLYFEYNISPFGSELKLLVPNFDGAFLGWRPWRDGPERQTQRATHIRGPAEPGAEIEGWSAEFFIPTALLAPLRNTELRPGVTWRANVYRIDFDDRPKVHYFTWQDVGKSFHDYQNFGRLVLV